MRKRHMTIQTWKCCPGRLESSIISYRVILETYTLTQPQLSNRFYVALGLGLLTALMTETYVCMFKPLTLSLTNLVTQINN